MHAPEETSHIPIVLSLDPLASGPFESTLLIGLLLSFKIMNSKISLKFEILLKIKHSANYIYSSNCPTLFSVVEHFLIFDSVAIEP